MLEPITAAAAALIIERVYDRISRAHHRRKLMRMIGPSLPPGSEIGEHYGRNAGWYVKISVTLPIEGDR
jgi:hypothetical protein